MGFGGHDTLGQHPGTIPRQSSEAVFEAAAAAPGFSRCQVGVLTDVGVAKVAPTRIGNIGGVERHDGATGCEGVLTVGLLEVATHAMDHDFPELGIHRLEDLSVFNAFYLGFEIGADLKLALDLLIALLPDAASAVAGESRRPDVAVLVDATEVITQVASRLNGNGGCHSGLVAPATLSVA